MTSDVTSSETPIGSSMVISGKAVDVVVPLKQDEQVREAEEIGEVLVEAASEAKSIEEKAVILARLADTPRLTESGIAADVLERLLPDEGIVQLPRVKKVAGSLVYRVAKRVFDLLSCSVALVVLAIPMAAIAVKIKTESRGPVIYSQRRVGKNGQVFELYKFRSMYADAEAKGARWATEGDPRVTPFGKKMRKMRLAPVIIGTPGDGEPTKSLSHPENSSLDLQKCERRPGTSLGARHHYTSFQFLSFAVLRGPGGHLGTASLCLRAGSFRGRWDGGVNGKQPYG